MIQGLEWIFLDIPMECTNVYGYTPNRTHEESWLNGDQVIMSALSYYVSVGIISDFDPRLKS